jgi:hypothetical protein
MAAVSFTCERLLGPFRDVEAPGNSFLDAARTSECLNCESLSAAIDELEQERRNRV